MPWGNFTYYDTLSVYSDLLNEAYGKREIDLIIKESVVRAEMFKYDFTKRQMIIIMFIITFSYNCWKDVAYIPKLKDFSIAGISPTKIKQELDRLVDMNVIEWNRKENTFRIKDTRLWEVPYNSGYNDKAAIDLYFKNLEHSGMDVSKLIKKLKK
jgi:hypothetical protein